MVDPRHRVTFSPVEMMIGRGWYILVRLPSGRDQQLGGFNTEAEAQDWIQRKSADWLKHFENGKYS